MSILNLDTWRRKGLPSLLDGVKQASTVEPGIRLDIVGGGSDRSRALVSRMIARRGLDAVVTLVGALPNAELIARLPQYRALLLPSLNETFGMVYVEALFAGVPVLFTRGTAIDGYLDGLDVARAVPPGDTAEIADAVVELWRGTEQMRAHISAAAPRLFATFDPATNLERYRVDVLAALRVVPEDNGGAEASH